MSEKILLGLYQRLKDYSLIHELADVPKIANLAYEEILVSFLTMIDRFDGLEFLKKKILLEENNKVKIKVSVLLLPYDDKFAVESIRSLMKSQDQRVQESACDIIFEKYSKINDVKLGYETLINKIKSKRKI